MQRYLRQLVPGGRFHFRRVPPLHALVYAYVRACVGAYLRYRIPHSRGCTYETPQVQH